jgi:leader peptidase (prepilin peptidase) / N-methyltransferase
MTAFLAIVSGMAGLAIGSFLNVVIHRVPAKQSVVAPRSRCPHCETEISPRDNVPVISWLLLRGKCRNCKSPISPRYPLVELATAGLFAAAAVRFGADWALPAFCVFLASLLAISLIDLEHYIVPNRVIYPTLALCIPLLVIAAAVGNRWDWLGEAAVGGVAGFSGLFVIHVIQPRGMGFGDVRLAGVIGMMLGWLGLGHVALGLFLGFVMAAVIGIGLIITKLRSRKDAIPFGPFLAAGAAITVFFGNPLLHAYLHR